MSQTLLYFQLFSNSTMLMFVLNTTIVMISVLAAFHVAYYPFIFLLFSTGNIKVKTKDKILHFSEIYFCLCTLCR